MIDLLIQEAFRLRGKIPMDELLQERKNMKKKTQVLTGLVVFVAIYLIINMISICCFSTKDEKCKSDVAIILGAATYHDQVSPVYRERINHGIALYKKGYIKKIIVTGGVGNGNHESDANIARKYAVTQGIPVEDILIEDTSEITQENLENSKKIMDTEGYQTAIIVSDPLHMKRSILLAQDTGMTAYSSPTPTSMYTSLKTQIPFLAREVFYYVGYKWYRIWHIIAR